MIGTSVPYESTGRARQKGRTRAALIGAARGLLAEGITPTVEQAADRSEISRTTAYRYFRNQRELLLASYPELDRTSLLDADAPTDPGARLDLVLEQIGHQLLEHEAALRAALRVSLEGAPSEPTQLRRGRAITWIADALSPLKDTLGKAALQRLVLAIRAAYGIEPMIWLTDVGGLSRAAAITLMQGTARTLLRSALESRR